MISAELPPIINREFFEGIPSPVHTINHLKFIPKVPMNVSSLRGGSSIRGIFIETFRKSVKFFKYLKNKNSEVDKAK
jgi:hypothetical protein